VHRRESPDAEPGIVGWRTRRDGPGATELPCIRLRQEVDLRAASATASVERSVWLCFTRPFGIDDWSKVDWSKCAQLRQLDLEGRLAPLRPGASAAATLAAMDLHLCLPRLQYLSLRKNSLSALPEGISALTAQQTLWLDQNSLSALPESISALTALQCCTSAQNSLLVTLPGAAARFRGRQPRGNFPGGRGVPWLFRTLLLSSKLSASSVEDRRFQVRAIRSLRCPLQIYPASTRGTRSRVNPAGPPRAAPRPAGAPRDASAKVLP
jgi:hypothetical protein